VLGIDPRNYIDALPSVKERANQIARRTLAEMKAKGQVNRDNFCEYAESIAGRIVDEMGLTPKDKVVGSTAWTAILEELFFYGRENFPATSPQ
jgi:hypothetical protein